jgi:hypothetical protein
MSLASELAFEEDNKYCEKLKNQYIQEMKEILKNCGIKWDENYLIARYINPEFDKEKVDDSKWFYILLGKYIAIDDYQNNLNW